MSYVFLLHGLGRTSRSMRMLTEFLTKNGYEAKSLNYSSTRYSVESLVDQLIPQIANECPDKSKTVHFVGHSLGAILIHNILQKYRPINLGRIVALGPPYHGSAIIDHLGKYWLYRKIHGPAALQLGTKKRVFAIK